MFKLTRIQIIILVAIVLLIAFFIYKASTGYSARFFDNFWSDTTNISRLGFVFDKPHNFKVGDRVKIAQDAGAVFPAYDGTYTILEVNKRQGTLSPYNIVTDGWFLGNTPPNGGTASATLF